MSSNFWFLHRRANREVDAFWDSVVERSPAEPIRPEMIDAETAGTIRRLHALAPQPASASEFAERLFAQLSSAIPEGQASTAPSQFFNGELAEQNGEKIMNSATIAVPAPPRLPALPELGKRRRWAIAQLAGAALIIAVLIGGFYFFFDDRTEQPAVIPAITEEATPSSDVPTWLGNPARTNEMPGPGPEGEPVVLWRFQAGGPAGLGLAVVDGIVYSGSRDGVRHALDASTGAELWSVGTGGGGSNATVANGLAYFGSDNGNLYALDAKTGVEQWRYEAGGSADVTTSVEGILYGGTTEGLAFALDAKTGTELWRNQVTEGDLGSPTVGDGFLYYGGGDGTLYALDEETGEQIWSFASGRELTDIPTFADGSVYITPRDETSRTFQGEVISIDAITGEEQWRFVTPTGYACSAASLSEGVAYVDCGDGTTYALDAATGAEIWGSPSEGLVEANPVVVVGDILYVGSFYNRTIRALDAASGAEIWELVIDGYPGQMAVTDGVLYFGSSTGGIYAVGGSTNGDSEGTATSPAASSPVAEG